MCLKYIRYFDFHHNLLKVCVVIHIMPIKGFIFIKGKKFLNLKVLQNNYLND